MSNGMCATSSMEWLPDVQVELLGDGRRVYVASHPLFPGLTSQAETAAGAREQFSENLAFYVEHLRSLGRDLPPKQDMLVTFHHLDNDSAGTVFVIDTANLVLTA